LSIIFLTQRKNKNTLIWKSNLTGSSKSPILSYKMNNTVKTSLAIISVLIFLVLAFFFLPLNKIHWGKIELAPSRTITVTGQAQSQIKNQTATFGATVSAVNDNKETAINEVNQKTEALLKLLKEFGIAEEDLKTQNLNYYQREETFWEEGRQKSRPGQWTVSNTIEIKLRNVDKASALTDLLAKSGATNVWGPNFSLEENKDEENSLMEKAVADAQKKAEIMAKASGGKLGKIVSINEGPRSQPVFSALMESGGGTPIEPGTSTYQKTVTVVFEIN